MHLKVITCYAPVFDLIFEYGRQVQASCVSSVTASGRKRPVEIVSWQPKVDIVSELAIQNEN